MLQVVLFLIASLATLAVVARENILPAAPASVQAVRDNWNATSPPIEGWVDVTLPDVWRTRWPDHDGVVWYRMRWTQTQPRADIALYVGYVTLAGSISVNGQLLERDPQLVEPLSRMWNTPRYWRLPPSLQQVGENEVVVRVAGFAAYSGGVGAIEVGAADVLQQRTESERRLRLRLAEISLGIGITLGLFFLMLWLMRRTEVAFGWYAAQQLAWFPIAWNQVATSPWPFSSTHDYQSMTTAMLLVFSGCWAMFVLRFCGQRWPRREVALWVLLLVAAAAMVLAPAEHKRSMRELLLLLATIVNCSFDVIFVRLALRSGRTDQRILAAFALVAFIAGVHDALTALGLLRGEVYYATLTLNLTVIGAAVVLAWNFARNLRRIEGFNIELEQHIDEARGELASTLTRQHQLELLHARLGERVGLAHDLHDGLGGMLIGNIAEMEQAPDQQVPARAVLGMLQELRDDLRLIIDTAAAQHYGEHSLAQLLAPLRHRMTRLFEAHDIAVRWRVEGLEQEFLSNTRSLDLLRVLQEGLTNVLKHAAATRVEVSLVAATDALLLEIHDDGRGMSDSTNGGHGTGMRSMQARARRLGATLTFEASTGSGTRLCLRIPRQSLNAIA